MNNDIYKYFALNSHLNFIILINFNSTTYTTVPLITSSYAMYKLKSNKSVFVTIQRNKEINV